MNDAQKSKAQLLKEVKKLQNRVLELEKSEQNFKLFMDYLPGCAFIKDEKGKYVFLNKHYETIYGFDIQNLLGKGDEEIWDKETALIFKEKDNKIRSEKKSLEFEDKVYVKGKEYIWLTYKYSMPKDFIAGITFDISKQKQAERTYDLIDTPLKNSDGSISKLELFRDITEQKKAEEILLLSNRVLEASPNHISVIGTDFKYKYVNNAYTEPHGLDTDQITGMHVAKLLGKQTFETLVKPLLNKCFSGEEIHFESWFTFKKTGSRFMSVKYLPLITEKGQIDSLVVISQDNTEQKKSEQSLQQSESQLRQIIDLVPHFIFVKDETGKFEIVNKATAKVFGTTVEDLTGRRDEEFVATEEEKKHFRADDLEVIRSGKTKFIPKEPITDSENNIRYLQTTKVPFKFSTTKNPSLLGIAVDITKRVQLEEELRKSEVKFKTIAEFAYDWECWIGTDSKYIYVSPAVERITGYTPQEFYKDKEIIKKIIHPEDLALYFEHQHQKINSQTEPITFRIITKKGENRWIGHVCREVIDENGKSIGRRSSNRDITDRVLAEQEKTALREQLMQTQKMEAIAQLAGGIAHDFNNALTTVLGNVELLNMRLSANETTKKIITRIEESGVKMSQLTNQLLAYSRGGKYQPEMILLDEFVEEAIQQIKHLIDPAIRIVMDIGYETNYIEADFTQLQMVLSSIIRNSVEAIENKGIIKISSFQSEIDNQFIKTHPDAKTGTYICLSIKDNGSGMDKDTLERIFEPFFTTKSQGRGLGMASVYGIIKNHNGYIKVDSEPGNGTKVQIYFPLSKKIIDKKPTEVPVMLQGNGTILLVEDEEFVMELGLEVLEHLGYRTLSAKNGTEALHIVKTFDGKIDLTLLDMGLPDIPGEALYFKLIEARPDLKVIVCSGYSVDGPAQKVLDGGGLDFIQKPYSISAMSQMLSKYLKKD